MISTNKIVIKSLSGIIFVFSIIVLFLLIFKPIISKPSLSYLKYDEAQIYLNGVVTLEDSLQNCVANWQSFTHLYPIFTFLGIGLLIVSSVLQILFNHKLVNIILIISSFLGSSFGIIGLALIPLPGEFIITVEPCGIISAMEYHLTLQALTSSYYFSLVSFCLVILICFLTVFLLSIDLKQKTTN
ncbi:MAG: hypothetical protein ACTSSK_14855 [Candidatus Heimdallarchaeota archaeon]